MIICPTCNNHCDDMVKFCPVCGQKLLPAQTGDSAYSTAPASEDMPPYVVLQVTLKEKFIGTASKNLFELQSVINEQAAKGYRLHTISTTTGHSTGFGGGDRIQATMVFEKI